MSPKEFAEWASVLRLDPLVLLVLAYAVHEARRAHARVEALLREIQVLLTNR